MKALSVHPFYADAIVSGLKGVEVRTWRTDYRGDLLICSTQKLYHGTIPGHALGVVKLVDVVPLKKKHLKDAMMPESDYNPNFFAWVLDDNRLIVPIPVKGKLSLWNFEHDELIQYIPPEEWTETEENAGSDEPGEWWYKYWEPLIT